MGRKSKYTKELKLSSVKRYLERERSTISLVKEINTDHSVVLRGIKKSQVFDTSSTNVSYTKKFKERVVLDYLNGGGII